MKTIVQRKRIIIQPGDHAVIRDERSDKRVQRSARSLFIHIAEGARLSYIDLQQLADTASELTVMTVLMDAHSAFSYEGLHRGARYAKTVINLVLQGEGAGAQLNAGLLATGMQQYSFITTQHHRAPRAKSSCIVRTAVYDAACVQYYGSIDVDEQAQLSEAYQQQKAMLMSDQARAFAKPSLSIRAHDVQCGHGSAIGQLDEEHRLYLQGRGIDHDAAKQLLIRSFFDELYTDGVLQQIMAGVKNLNKSPIPLL
ncbi:SufD family Fe-S cluster assembly protein [Candidatus Dependentiae bacterium]|nr:MAG: SufD family Fe-S cluster assembly protein [Candidatus Dependentiae bacterium]